MNEILPKPARDLGADRRARLGSPNLSRTQSVTVRLTAEEYEWLRRKAHWDDTRMAVLLRRHIRTLIADFGYLRPPDDEPQDFGFEKELMQFVVAVQNEHER